MHFNKFWKKQVEQKGGRYRHHSSEAVKPHESLPAHKAVKKSPRPGPHKSGRKLNNELLATVLRDSKDFSAAVDDNNECIQQDNWGRHDECMQQRMYPEGPPIIWGKTRPEHSWYCKPLRCYLTESEMEGRINALRQAKERYDAELAMEQEKKNEQGTALENALSAIGDARGLKRLAEPHSEQPPSKKSRRGQAS